VSGIFREVYVELFMANFPVPLLREILPVFELIKPVKMCFVPIQLYQKPQWYK